MPTKAWIASIGTIALVLAGPPPAVDHAQAETVSTPVAAGKTVISVDGSSGITLKVPAQTEITVDTFKIDLSAGRHAFLGIATHDCVPDGVISTCMFWRLFYQPDYPYIPYKFLGTDPPTISPGLYDLYFVSDGQGTLTLTFPGLTGTEHLDAAGSIDGELRTFRPSCPESVSVDPRCVHFGHGGSTRSVQKYAAAASVVYGWLPQPDPWPVGGGSLSVRPCIYPNPDQPNQSSDPANHPHGCPLSPTDPTGTSRAVSPTPFSSSLGSRPNRRSLSARFSASLNPRPPPVPCMRGSGLNSGRSTRRSEEKAEVTARTRCGSASPGSPAMQTAWRPPVGDGYPHLNSGVTRYLRVSMSQCAGWVNRVATRAG
ncbi:MAG: hypothetical protein ABR600_08520 [Actinomycetota bacterium]